MTVLAVTVGLFLLLLGLLSLPVVFSGRIRLTPSPAGEVELAWTGGLLGARVAIDGRRPVWSLRLGTMVRIIPRRSKGRSADAGTEKDGREARRKDAWRSGLKSLYNGEVVSKGIAYGRSLIRSLRLKLRLAGEYGTGEPDLTGYLTAFLAAVSGGPVDLDLAPDFTAACLDVQGELQGRLIPLQVMWLTGRFLLARPVRQLWWSKMIRRKFKSPRRS